MNDDNGKYVENARISSDGKLMNGRVNKYLAAVNSIPSGDREQDIVENQVE